MIGLGWVGFGLVGLDWVWLGWVGLCEVRSTAMKPQWKKTFVNRGGGTLAPWEAEWHKRTDKQTDGHHGH